MIFVTSAEDALVVALQPDHAATAGQVARAWRPPAFLSDPNRDRLIEATTRHDDGWNETERMPVLDPDGQPLDFLNIPTVKHIETWRRSVELAKEDPYVGLLVAAHARWLYTRHGDGETPQEQAAAQRFIEYLDTRMNTWIDALRQGGRDETSAVEPRHLEKTRRLVSLFDALSLTLLGAFSPDALKRTEPVAFGDEQAPLRITLDERGATVRPWPFREPMVHLSTRALQLNRSHFDNADQWRQTLASAAPYTLSWVLHP